MPISLRAIICKKASISLRKKQAGSAVGSGGFVGNGVHFLCVVVVESNVAAGYGKIFLVAVFIGLRLRSIAGTVRLIFGNKNNSQNNTYYGENGDEQLNSAAAGILHTDILRSGIIYL